MKKSARVTDNHSCPFVDPSGTPHTGGPINSGCTTVIAEDQFQAIISGLMTCVGPVDVITSGASTVHIRGMFAARQTDQAAHGGTVVGAAGHVFIGGPTHVSRPVRMLSDGRIQYGSSIVIANPADRPDFQARALAAYVRLDTTDGMNEGLNDLEATGHTVTVIPYVPPGPNWGPFNAYCRATSADNSTPGVGSDSVIGWDPDVHGFGEPGSTADWEQPGSDIMLGHETDHAIHNAEGTYPSEGPFVENSDGTQGVNIPEDRNTVGLPGQVYNNPSNPGDDSNGDSLPDTRTDNPSTENRTRAEYEERGVPSPVLDRPVGQRPSYYPSSTGGQPF